jgi:hypothetical protein
MKQTFKIILLFFGMMAGLQAEACEICGCGVGSYYYGILPQFHRNFAGIRYRFRNYNSHVGSFFQTNETYQTTEIWARFYPSRKLQLMAFIPYNFNVKTEAGVTQKLNGLSDMALLANYTLYATPQDSMPHTFRHNLMIGGGVKLPTGSYKYEESDLVNVANPNFQLGTGSTDFIASLIYTIRHKKWGVNADMTYKMNTQNKNQYQFGNRLNAAMSLFYLQKIGRIGLMPNAGLTAEISAEDKKSSKEVINTGGYLTMATIGTEIYFGKISTGVNFQNPLSQHLADGNIRANARGMVHLTVMF